MNETITINRDIYNKLCLDSFWLECLEEAGVDNWSGYDEARSLWRKGTEETKLTLPEDDGE